MKKRGSLPLQIVVVAIILLIVAAIVIFAFRNLFGKSAGVVGDQLSSFGDCDGDDLRDFQDKCPYDRADASQNSEFPGCKGGVNAGNIDERKLSGDYSVQNGKSRCVKDVQKAKQTTETIENR